MVLPVHAIKPPELADKTLSFPKIPKKNTGAPLQISSAEILEKEEDIPVKEIEAQIEKLEQEITEELVIAPELNQENTIKAFALFAAKQKVSIVSLIKILIPAIDMVQLGKVPADLISKFSLVVYSDPVDAAFKSMGLE